MGDWPPGLDNALYKFRTLGVAHTPAGTIQAITGIFPACMFLTGLRPGNERIGDLLTFFAVALG